MTKFDEFPLPRIDDLLDQFGLSQYFTTLELAAGYRQVKVSDKSKEKIPFRDLGFSVAPADMK